MSTAQTLIDQLTAALTQVITDEGVLQQAITAVQGVVTTPVGVDPTWEAVQLALTDNGWVAPVSASTSTSTSASPSAPTV
jgi:hypothetical protein